MYYCYVFTCYYVVTRFEDKTKNRWEDRHDFVKVPGKYDLLEMDYGIEEVRERRGEREREIINHKKFVSHNYII